MSKTLLAILFVAVVAQSVYCAGSFAITDASFEKAPLQIATAAEALVLTSTNIRGYGLIAGKNSKTNYLYWLTSVYTDSVTYDNTKGGIVTATFRKLDASKLTVAKGNVDTVVSTGFSWGSSSAYVGASVKNNVTLVREAYPAPSATNAVSNIYAYLIDIENNKNYEVVVASATKTSEFAYTNVDIQNVWADGDLTVVVYTTTTSTVALSADDVTATYIVTIKKDTVSTPLQLSANDSPNDCSGTSKEAYCIFSATTGVLTTTRTDTLVAVDLEKMTAASPVTLRTQSSDDKLLYSLGNVFAHPKDRWVVTYTNYTGESNSVDRVNNLFALASNHTGEYKTIVNYKPKPTDSSTVSYSAQSNYLGGLFVLVTETSTVSGTTTKIVSSQLYDGAYSIVQAKQTLLTTSGDYVDDSELIIYRLGTNKAVNVLITKVLDTDTADEVTEAVYYGQLYEKSFGATLHSLVALCSFVLAALFLF